METVPIDVCCLKLGWKYEPDHVNNLFKQVEKTTTINNFICYTDNPSLLNTNITCKQLKPIYNDRMWWNKVLLMEPELHERRTIYLDLDVYVHNDLNTIEEGQVLKTNWFSDVVSDAIHGSNINSSVMVFDRDQWGHEIWQSQWHNWNAYGDKLYKSFYGLDMWLYRHHKLIQYKFIESGLVYSYKFGCEFPNDIEQEVIRDDKVLCIFDDYDGDKLKELWNVSSM